MNNRILFPTLAAAGALFAATLAAHDLYWTEEAVIMASDIDGGNVTEVFDGTGMNGIAVDIHVTDDHLYWTEHADSSSQGGVWRADRDGSNAALFVENNGSFTAPHFLVVSETHNRIYFTCFSSGIIQADLDDGGNVSVLWDQFPTTFTGITLRGENELVWMTTVADAIYRTQLPSGNTPQGDAFINVPGAGETYGAVYHAGSDALYFTNFGAGTLHRFDFDTGEATLLREGLAGPLGVKLSPSETHLLIAERGNGVTAYQLDNFGYELIPGTSGAHFGVAVTADPAPLDEGTPPPPPPEEGDPVFFTDFQNDVPGDVPLDTSQGGVWSTVSEEPAEGSVMVMLDEDNVFGFGTDNHFLRYESMRGFDLDATFEGLDVLTVNFDVITRFPDGDSGRWLNVRVRSGGTDAHILSLRNNSQRIRGDSDIGDPRYAEPDVPVRLSLVVNNATDTITYDGPDGDSHDLASTFASVWVYEYLTREWIHLIPEYQRDSDAAAGTLMDLVRFQIDSNSELRSFDLDNISVIKGAVIPEPAEFEFPHDLPAVRIHRAVEIEFDTVEGAYYLVESSEDLEEWTPAAPPFAGTGEVMSRFISTRDDAPRAFRVISSEPE